MTSVRVVSICDMAGDVHANAVPALTAANETVNETNFLSSCSRVRNSLTFEMRFSSLMLQSYDEIKIKNSII